MVTGSPNSSTVRCSRAVATWIKSVEAGGPAFNSSAQPETAATIRTNIKARFMKDLHSLRAEPGFPRLRPWLMVGSSEEKLAILVLKQEGLFFSAFDLLDQEAAPL